MIETNRLIFKTWSLNDIELAYRLWGNKDVTRYICASGVFSNDDIENRLKTEIDNYNNYGIQYFPAYTKDNEFIGCCGLRLHNEYDYEFGIHLLPEYWNNGYGVECGEAIKKYAKEILKCHILFAGHNPNNIRSKGLLLKLGFKYIKDEYYKPTGLYHPSYILEL